MYIFPMVFQFLTSLIMDMFVWAFHDDADPRVGKSLLWFWQQALRCVLQCRALATLLSHNGSEKQTKDTQKASVPGLFTFWHWRKLLINHLPRTPHPRCAWLETICKTKKISDTRVKNKSNVFKNITLNATTVQKFPGAFSVSPTTICALWKGQERLSLSPSCHLSLGSSPRECETNLQLLKTALPQILELPLSIGRETFPCRLWQHRKGEAMT